jgi:hypothetical protein
VFALLVTALGGSVPIAASTSAGRSYTPQALDQDTVQPLATSPLWSTETIDPDAKAGLYASAAIGSADEILVAYSYDDSRGADLRFATDATGTWVLSDVDTTGSVGTHNAIALTSTGSPLISYYDQTNGNLKLATGGKTSWTLQTVDAAAADVGSYSSLAIDPRGDAPHIAYYDATGRDLKYATHNGVSWQISVIASRDAVGEYASLALRGAAPRVAYYSATTDSLQYAVRSEGGWAISTATKAGQGGQFASLAMDTNGYERVAYSLSGTGVQAASRSYAGWTLQSVASDSGTIIPTALALDSMDAPHIAYVGGDGALRYATHDGKAWQIAIVDDSRDIGNRSVCIVLDAAENPHILYHSTSQGLKHAIYTPMPDLIVTDIWQRGDEIWCQIRNIGKAEAPGRHMIALSVDGTPTGTFGVSNPLAPGERLSVRLATAWSCTGATNTVRVVADRDGDVIEADEDNNAREEVWTCDTTPPVLSRIAVSEGTNNAVITWNTDEATSGRVYHAANAAIMTRFVDDPNPPGTSHSATITGLMPGRTYRYRVESTDLAGNTAASREGFFQTAGTPVTLPETTVDFRRISDQYMVYEFAVSLDDVGALADVLTKAVDSVTFYARPISSDGTPLREFLVGTSYTPLRSPTGATVYSIGANLGLLDFTNDEVAAPVFEVRADIKTIDDVIHRIVEPRPAPEWGQHPIEAFIISPGPGQVFYGDENGDLPPGTQILLSAEAVEFRQSCTYSPELRVGGMYVSTDCRDVATLVEKVQFWIDGILAKTLTAPTPNTYQYEVMFDASQLNPGDHSLRVSVHGTDSSSSVQHLHETFSIEAVVPDPILPAPLTLERTVTRNGTYFDVELSIGLLSGPPVTLYELKDWVREFMPVRKTALNYGISVGSYPLGTSGQPARSGQVKVSFYGGYVLSAGQTLTVRYSAVPILHEDGNLDAAIGNYAIVLDYEKEGNAFTKLFDRPWQNNGLVQTAIASSDYIMVTNPARLGDMPGVWGLNLLYGSMARLATLRNGVLGFLDTYDTATLDDLLESNGYWFESLHPAFRTYDNNGYVLIVGESEIVPAFTVSEARVTGYGTYELVEIVDYSDQQYASSGGTMRPELNLGRIIGWEPAMLRAPIETSIAHAEGQPEHQYDATGPAIVLASPTEDYFEHDAILIAAMMNDVGIDALRISLPETNPGSVTKALIDDGYSIIHLRGHGTSGDWDGGLEAEDALPNVSFGGYSPFIFATTCLTGRYPGWGLAETLMYKGAAVYIGATEVSWSNSNLNYSLDFYQDYWDVSSGEPIGRAFARLERAIYSTDFSEKKPRYWVYEYNLYGDPRFGAAGTHTAPAAVVGAAALALPAATRQVQVPAYEVTTTPEGLDAVRIPGGRLLLEPGFPQVPYWVETLVYPAGARVQDVTLTWRQGCTSDTGLNLPVTTEEIDSAPVVGFGQATALAIEDDAWLPGLDDIYRWEVIEHPDGSSRLEIRINPFHYQAATTNHQWCDDFTFDIDVLVTDVNIDTFTLDKGAYDPGDVVSGDLWVSNPGDPQDVVVTATISGSGAPDIALDGLEIGGLPGVEGDGHYRLSWDSTEAPPASYVMNVHIYNLEGTLLHSASRTFALGAPMSEVIALSATPLLFTPGDSIQLAATVQNTGPVPVSGDVIIEVVGLDTDTVVQTFTETVTDLAPGATHVMAEVWDTSDADEASYRVSAYMTYASKATNIETLTVNNRDLTNYKVYLPLVMR